MASHLEVLIWIPAAIHLSARWRSVFDDASRTTSSAKRRNGILRPQNLTPSTTWLHLEILTSYRMMSWYVSIKYWNNNESRINMCSIKCLLLLFSELFISYLHPEKKTAASKLQNKRLKKYVNIKIGQWFLVHRISKVSNTDVLIYNCWTYFSVVRAHMPGEEGDSISQNRSAQSCSRPKIKMVLCPYFWIKSILCYTI